MTHAMKFFTADFSGQSLIELLMAIGLAAILLPAIIVGLMASREGKPSQEQRLQAITIMKEVEEAVRSIRDRDWTAFAINGTYYTAISGSQWVLTACPTVSGSPVCPADANGFTQQIDISDASRNNGAIVTSGGTTDPSTKKIDITISWTKPRAASLTASAYMTRHDNLTYTDTKDTDFSPGTLSNTAVTNYSGGEVILGAGGGGGDWCQPSLSVTSVNLARQGVPTTIAAYPGNIVTGTGGNASGPTFVKTLVSGNSPVVASISGQFNNSKTNGIFTEGNYGYIATTNHSQEIQILDLTTTSGNPPTYSMIGYFNAPGNGQGNSVYVANNVGYMTDGSNFYTFDLSSRSGSRPQLNTSKAVSLAGTGNKVVVVGNYAYVVTSSTTTQLQVVDVTDPKNPAIVASANLNNSQAGVDVSVNSTGTRAYIVTNYASSTQPDFFIVDTTTKSGTLPLIGTGYNTSGMSPKGVNIATGNKAIIVGTGGTKQYQVINISSETAPTVCGTGLAITNGAYAVTSVLQSDGYAYSYVVTGDTNNELKIILGGAGGQYSSTGTFTSKPYDVTSQGLTVSAFNRFDTTFLQPPQTTIKFQVAVANAVNNSCTGASYSFIGPDTTSATYFATSSAIPLLSSGSYQNPGRCFKYKVYFSSSDSSQTPELDDITVNFSP